MVEAGKEKGRMDIHHFFNGKIPLIAFMDKRLKYDNTSRRLPVHLTAFNSSIQPTPWQPGIYGLKLYQ
jgi:hypothetical protein